jgi:hypothetical protein
MLRIYQIGLSRGIGLFLMNHNMLAHKGISELVNWKMVELVVKDIPSGELINQRDVVIQHTG